MFENEIEEYELVRQEYQQKVADRMGEKQSMEEIKIYRIVWKNILAAIVCLALVVMGVFYSSKAGVVTLGLFFGLGGLFLLYLTLKVRLRPYLTINDKCLVQSRADKSLPDYTINFSEVDHFELSRYNILFPFERDILVYYKTDKDKQKVFSPTFFGRIAAKLFSSADDYIAIHGINMKPQELFDLLSERVNHGNR